MHRHINKEIFCVLFLVFKDLLAQRWIGSLCDWFTQAKVVSIGLCRYELVIWLIKITNAAVERPGSRPHLVEGQTATVPRQLVTKTNVD